MNFFRCLCLCFGAMMFLGAVRGKCMESGSESNDNCVICGKKSEMIFYWGEDFDVIGSFCKLGCFKEFLKRIMTEKEVNYLYIDCKGVTGYPESFILRAVRFNNKVLDKTKNNALVENKGSKGFFFEVVESCKYTNGVLNVI